MYAHAPANNYCKRSNPLIGAIRWVPTTFLVMHVPPGIALVCSVSARSNGAATAFIRFWPCSVTGKGLSSRESNRRNATPLSDEAGNSDRAPDAMRSTPNSDSLVNLGPTSNAAEDDIFFESLPGLVQEVTEKLTLLLDLESESIAVGDIPINPPATDGIGAVPEVDPREETVLHFLFTLVPAEDATGMQMYAFSKRCQIPKVTS